MFTNVNKPGHTLNPDDDQEMSDLLNLDFDQKMGDVENEKMSDIENDDVSMNPEFSE